MQDTQGPYAYFVEFSEQQRLELQKLIQGETVKLKVDVTGGKALAISTTEDSLMGHISKGGIWIIPILTFALVSIITGIFKFVQIYRIKLPEVKVLHEILSQLKAGKRDKARMLAQIQPAPMNVMLTNAVDNADRGKDYVGRNHV